MLVELMREVFPQFNEKSKLVEVSNRDVSLLEKLPSITYQTREPVKARNSAPNGNGWAGSGERWKSWRRIHFPRFGRSSASWIRR